MSSSYLVVLGAAASFERLRRTLAAACPGAEVRPALGSRMRPRFPETDNVVFVTTGGESRGRPRERASGRDGLVSHRHTPTAALRGMVRKVVREFGSARVLVCQGAGTPPCSSIVPIRSQTTTLAGFLRSGRVVQDDTLLSIFRA